MDLNFKYNYMTIETRINSAMQILEQKEKAIEQFSNVADEIFTKQIDKNKKIDLSNFIDNIVSLDETGSFAEKANQVFKKYGAKKTDYEGRISLVKNDGDFAKSFTESGSPCVVSSCIDSFIEPFECENNIFNNLFDLYKVPYCLGKPILIPFTPRFYETAPIVADGATPPAMSTTLTNGCITVTPERRAKSDFLLKSQICNPNVCFDLYAQKTKNMLNLQKNTNNDVALTWITTNGTNVDTSGTSNLDDALNLLKYRIVQDSENDDNIVMFADRLVVMQLLDEKDANQRPLYDQTTCDFSCPTICYNGKNIIGINHPALKPVTVAGVTTALVVAGQKSSGKFIYSDDNLTQCEECDGREQIKMHNSFIAEVVVPSLFEKSYAFTTLVL